jgi:hypothetical protein
MPMAGYKDYGCHLMIVIVVSVAMGFRNGPVLSSVEWVVVVIRPMECRFLLHRCQCHD